MTHGHGGIALATVATDSFVPGAEVLLDSFIRHHPGFDGELIVIHDGLGADAQARLQRLSPAVRLKEVGADIAGQVDALVARLPDLGPTRSRFYSLEALRPRGFERVLFCDSDMLFLGPIDELLGGSTDVRAVGDGCFLRGHARHAETFAERPVGADTIDDTFNAGLMRFGPAALTGEDFSALLSRLDHAWFSRLQCGLHDQSLFNRQFHKRVALESWRYNFLLRHRRLVLGAEPFKLPDIRVLHFNMRAKPWQVGAPPEIPGKDPLLAWALRCWHDAAAQAVSAENTGA